MSKRLLILFALLGVVASACQAENRPAVEEWRAHWDRVIAAVPTEEALSGEDAKTLCDTALTLLREERQYLLPAPESTLDDPVDDWLNVADETFFECPPRSGEIQGFAEAFVLMDDYHAEVEAALAE